MKFGGNVLGSQNGILSALQIIETQSVIWDNLVVVSSALSGVTDSLHRLVNVAASGNQHEMRDEIARLREIHAQAARMAIHSPRQLETLLQELDNLIFDLIDDCDYVRRERQAEPRIADRVIAQGERFVTRMIAAAARTQYLKCVAVDASRVIVTDDRHFNARPIKTLSKQNLDKNLSPLLEGSIIPIVTGYIGATEKGAITTLGRGGSDYSATYLGALLAADEVWFFTDVDGLMSADPAVVPNAHVLTNSSYDEVAELARFGARVLHPRAVEPLIEHRIPLRIRSVAHPGGSGTYIYEQTGSRTNPLHAVTQALAVMIIGPGQSNMAEACNRLLSQYLSDDMHPTLQVEVHAKSVLVYVAPTSANQEAFFNCVEQLKNYDSGGEWIVGEVTVIAAIGNLGIDEQVAILSVLADAAVRPYAIGQGPNGTFLMAVEPEIAHDALREIHTLIEK